MLCFNDTTFCSAACGVRSCPQRYTEDVQKAADRWWRNPSAPVSTGDLSQVCALFVPPERGESKETTTP